MPVILKSYGASVAFGLPGLLMLAATLILWGGRRKYVHQPAQGANPHSFLKVVWTALKGGGAGAAVAAVGVPGCLLCAEPL